MKEQPVLKDRYVKKNNTPRKKRNYSPRRRCNGKIYTDRPRPTTVFLTEEIQRKLDYIYERNYVKRGRTSLTGILQEAIELIYSLELDSLKKEEAGKINED